MKDSSPSIHKSYISSTICPSLPNSSHSSSYMPSKTTSSPLSTFIPSYLSNSINGSFDSKQNKETKIIKTIPVISNEKNEESFFNLYLYSCSFNLKTKSNK